MKFLIFRLVEWLYTDYVIVMRIGTHLRVSNIDDGSIAVLDVSKPFGHRIQWIRTGPGGGGLDTQ